VRRRVLLTGGTGFVGANLVRRLLADGHAVHLVVRPERSLWRLAGIRDDVKLHQASLEDRAAVERVVRRARPEWIFHLAAHGAYSWETDLDRILAVNLLGTVNLVRACLRPGFDAFVNAGSSSEYGFKKRAPTEREWVEPNSHYAIAKVAATHFCRFTARSERVSIATLRLYSVYGPWEEPGRLMPTLIVQGLAGRLPALVEPRIARDYVYVDDVCDAFVRAAAKPGIFDNVDGIKFLSHQAGCGGTREDGNNLCALIAGYLHHPNVAGATVLSLGCQNSQVSILREQIARRDPNFSKPLLVFEQQKSGSEFQMISEAIRDLIGMKDSPRAPAR